MGRTYATIDGSLERWLLDQHLFFIGTAPLAPEGLINVSPKGGAGMFTVLGPTAVAYLDIAGSGVETIAHLRENGRVVLMFCAFDGRPRIVRLHGSGRVHLTGDPAFAELRPYFSQATVPAEGVRSIIEVEVGGIADSCGYSVPLMTFEGERPHRDLWIEKRLKGFGPDGVERYVRENNVTSLDGLPAVDPERL
ncbi:MAG: pyridoxamine 5'-phosphate oxidase family protein [Actinomycetota bacterium]